VVGGLQRLDSRGGLSAASRAECFVRCVFLALSNIPRLALINMRSHTHTHTNTHTQTHTHKHTHTQTRTHTHTHHLDAHTPLTPPTPICTHTATGAVPRNGPLAAASNPLRRRRRPGLQPGRLAARGGQGAAVVPGAADHAAGGGHCSARGGWEMKRRGWGVGVGRRRKGRKRGGCCRGAGGRSDRRRRLGC